MKFKVQSSKLKKSSNDEAPIRATWSGGPRAEVVSRAEGRFENLSFELPLDFEL